MSREALARIAATGSEKRLGKVSQRTRYELRSMGAAEREEVLARGIDELAYCAERDGQAIASTEILVRHDDEQSKNNVAATRANLTAKLGRHHYEAVEELQQFAQLIQSVNE